MVAGFVRQKSCNLECRRQAATNSHDGQRAENEKGIEQHMIAQIRKEKHYWTVMAKKLHKNLVLSVVRLCPLHIQQIGQVMLREYAVFIDIQ